MILMVWQAEAQRRLKVGASTAVIDAACPASAVLLQCEKCACVFVNKIS